MLVTITRLSWSKQVPVHPANLSPQVQVHPANISRLRLDMEPSQAAYDRWGRMRRMQMCETRSLGSHQDPEFQLKAFLSFVFLEVGHRFGRIWEGYIYLDVPLNLKPQASFIYRWRLFKVQNFAVRATDWPDLSKQKVRKRGVQKIESRCLHSIALGRKWNWQNIILKYFLSETIVHCIAIDQPYCRFVLGRKWNWQNIILYLKQLSTAGLYWDPRQRGEDALDCPDGQQVAAWVHRSFVSRDISMVER